MSAPKIRPPSSPKQERVAMECVAGLLVATLRTKPEFEQVVQTIIVSDPGVTRQSAENRAMFLLLSKKEKPRTHEGFIAACEEMIQELRDV